MAGLYNLIMPPIIHYLYSPGEARAVRLMCNYDGPGLTSLHSTRHKLITLYTRAGNEPSRSHKNGQLFFAKHPACPLCPHIYLCTVV